MSNHPSHHAFLISLHRWFCHPVYQLFAILILSKIQTKYSPMKMKIWWCEYRSSIEIVIVWNSKNEHFFTILTNKLLMEMVIKLSSFLIWETIHQNLIILSIPFVACWACPFFCTYDTTVFEVSHKGSVSSLRWELRLLSCKLLARYRSTGWMNNTIECWTNNVGLISTWFPLKIECDKQFNCYFHYQILNQIFRK